jgi:hypothetical protein
MNWVRVGGSQARLEIRVHLPKDPLTHHALPSPMAITWLATQLEPLLENAGIAAFVEIDQMGLARTRSDQRQFHLCNTKSGLVFVLHLTHKDKEKWRDQSALSHGKLLHRFG